MFQEFKYRQSKQSSHIFHIFQSSNQRKIRRNTLSHSFFIKGRILHDKFHKQQKRYIQHKFRDRNHIHWFSFWDKILWDMTLHKFLPIKSRNQVYILNRNRFCNYKIHNLFYKVNILRIRNFIRIKQPNKFLRDNFLHIIFHVLPIHRHKLYSLNHQGQNKFNIIHHKVNKSYQQSQCNILLHIFLSTFLPIRKIRIYRRYIHILIHKLNIQCYKVCILLNFRRNRNHLKFQKVIYIIHSLKVIQRGILHNKQLHFHQKNLLKYIYHSFKDSLHILRSNQFKYQSKFKKSLREHIIYSYLTRILHHKQYKLCLNTWYINIHKINIIWIRNQHKIQRDSKPHKIIFLLNRRNLLYN